MKRNKRSHLLRRMMLESLESRSLLAAVVGDSPWQNPLDADDLNCDGSVSPADALMAINALNGGMSGQLSARMAPPGLHGRVQGATSDFLDANGDGSLSPADPLDVINALNQGLHLGQHGSGLPTTDQQPDVVGPDAQVIDLTHNFAKVRAAINTDSDVDVFQVTPTKTNLNVALFSAGGGAMTVNIVTADGTVLGTAATDAGSHRPARTDLTVTPSTTYYLVVKGDTGVTGAYGLTVLNYSPEDVTPTIDSPLGTDVHPEAPPGTALTLDHGHARVSSNIDTAGDKDVFQVTAVDGKLVVEADAEFPLTVIVSDKDGNVLDPITTSHEHVLVFNVTAAAGPYSISIAAANGTDTGAYRMNVVNAPVSQSGGDDGDDDDSGDQSGDDHGAPLADKLFARLDANSDSAVSLDEFKAGVPGGGTPLSDKVFAAWDADQNGTLSLDEFVAGLTSLPPFVHNRSGDGPRGPLVTHQ